MSSAPAVRPGTPSFGRPVGVSTTGEKSLLTTAQRAMVEQNKMMEDRKSSAVMPDIVADMADRFFLQKTVAAPAPPAPEATRPIEMAPQPEAGRSDEREWEDSTFRSEEKDDSSNEYVPPGTYLDVSA